MTVKLFDFGLAACFKKSSCAVNASYQMTGYAGTRVYMAPEVARREPYNEKVDIYSFGMILWQMLTGQMPFKGMSKEEHLEKVIRGGVRPSLFLIDSTTGEVDSNQRHPNISEKMGDLIERCWHEDFRVRPSSGEILAALLKEAEYYSVIGAVMRTSRAALGSFISFLRPRSLLDAKVGVTTDDFDQLDESMIISKKEGNCKEEEDRTCGKSMSSSRNPVPD